jgi:hypothetical protein
MVLLGLAVLPGLYFLLRLTPPAASRIAFPPLALLRGLAPAERTPHRMPLWLLLLRMLAVALVIFGLAGPALHPPPALPGTGPVLLVIDNGWAAAAGWPARLQAAKQIIAAAELADRPVAILATARDASNAAPQIQGVMPAATAAQMVAALQPQPWPVDRAGATAALRGAVESSRIYLADGITDGPGFGDFMDVLHADRIIAPPAQAKLLLAPSLDARGSLVAHITAASANPPVLAQTAAGDVLANVAFSKSGNAVINLPLALSNRVTELRLDAAPSAGSVFLLDSNGHAVSIGLSASSTSAETPFLGLLYFTSRALPPGNQIVTGDLATLMAEKASVIVLADVPLTATQQQTARRWIAGGGVIIRFAGPLTADTPDTLAPDPLLAGDRRLGGALTWTTPQALAPFPAASPLAGLPSSGDATVTRQVLADPTRLDAATVWATLADGTPLVLGRSIGKGFLVAVLTTANADWSNLALSGIYPAMLERLAALSRGAPVQPNQKLPMLNALNANGNLVAPPANPASISAADLAQTSISPLHPPGLYGIGGSEIALNLGGHITVPAAAALPEAEILGAQQAPENFGGDLLAAAMLLQTLDLLIALAFRGLLNLPRRAWVGGFALILAAGVLTANALPATAQPAGNEIPPGALQTQLAFIRTGDAAADQISADGLGYLSALVTARSSAQLGDPVGVSPDTDGLNLYPIIYWPVLPGAPAPSEAGCTALNSYMQHGGLLLIDSPGGDADATGSGAGFAPGASAALARAIACLDVPPLEPLTTANAIAHSFYILQSFPGKFVGDPVLIARAGARDADGVTPIIIGQNDWAGAWARDANGEPEQTPLPGDEDQRVTADRFGTNLVIYALTGDYKSDQTNLPAFLDKLGQ